MATCSVCSQALLPGHASCVEVRAFRKGACVSTGFGLHALRTVLRQIGPPSSCPCVQAPKAEAAEILQQRFPVPRLVDCDQNGSQVRVLAFHRQNPWPTRSEQSLEFTCCVTSQQTVIKRVRPP